ncbi:ABC transporter ATP-binding protein [Modicisalibacter luteus]|uniref:ABC transporter ATP-binding protein n=1 Tax=Modicisalibacter luteus TaxID=453962 RepID=A0ABV7M0G8_9GAMM|nr:ABC transporter ATP-binding protein [Halomonas lutea]GHB05384.1 ABC transporter ATP-binding protein [Halomonas lutea]
MFYYLKELYSLLSQEQRKKLFRLQILAVIMAFAEIAGVISIGPFMALVGNMEQLEGQGLLADVYRASGAETPETFLLWVGGSVLALLLASGLFSMYTIWRMSLYGAHVGAELSSRLYNYYMHQGWLFHASGNSSTLTNRISEECQRVMTHIIIPLMHMNSKLTLALFMALAIFIYNPIVALSGVAVFLACYFLLFKTVRGKLIRNGKTISSSQSVRFKLMAEGFGGIKDALLLRRQDIFTKRFGLVSEKYAEALGTNQALSLAPRYAMEIVAFGCVIFLVLYLLAQSNGNVVDLLPVLSIYALAGFKIMPALQQVYNSLSQIRGNLAAYEAIREELKASVQSAKGSKDYATKKNKLPVQKDIVLKGIGFAYPGKTDKALNEVDLRIPVNKTVGLVGASGSGKSTLVDILLGLIEPDQGSLVIDGCPLTKDTLACWQNALGFVPQSIFLADASIKENIAFGLPEEAIDMQRVQNSAKQAHLDEFLDKLPDGLDTRVGERGVQLSGGQRQRIGIARALYHESDVLVLDEATSALDGITENHIMQAIQSFSGQKTIVMIAHRLATVKQCDLIYLMRDGKVVDQGTYEDLVVRNETFKRMAEHA